ncbi:FAD-dependent monooxygenase [Haloferacaceae archaeon DSL9]
MRTIETDVVVVGAGPAGCLLGDMLARSGVETALLERNATFEREYRGYLWQPRAVDLFEQLGLLAAVESLDHEKLRAPTIRVDGYTYPLFDFGASPGSAPYALLMEQPPLLGTLVERAGARDAFSFHRQTTAEDLIIEDGAVVGVRAHARAVDDRLTIRSRLVVGADGRYSTVRAAAGIDPGLFDSRLALLWFKLPREVADATAQARFGPGGQLLSFGLGEEDAQFGWFLERDAYPALREAGIEAFHERLVRVDPTLENALPAALPSFDRCSLLRIEPGISDEWVRDGLALVGDAAHVASPIGAQGNSLAAADAVVAHAAIVRALAETGSSGPLSADALQPYVDARRPAVERVVRTQRRVERLLELLVRSRSVLPDALVQTGLHAAFDLLPRTPLATRTRDLFANGPAPVEVDAALFE